MEIIYLEFHIAEWCKGSTNDSDSFCMGSNPISAAISKGRVRLYQQSMLFYFYIAI